MADTTQSTAAPDLSRVSQLTDAKSLVEKVKSIKNTRIKQERDWKLNLAFYRGNQWIWFNRFTGQVQTIPEPDEQDGPRYRVRLTSNQILPGVQGLLAMMNKTKPVITATPDTGSERDIRAAQMAEQLYDEWWRDLHLAEKREEATLWSILGSAGYWKITWDPFAGKAMSFLVDPNGQPILDMNLADIYRDELQQSGQDPRQYEKTVYMGDVRVDVLPPENVYVLDGGGVLGDATAIICKHPMTPDEVKMRYGVDLKPNAAINQWFVPDSFLGMEGGNTSQKDVVEIYIGYFKPTASLPTGRYVVFVEDPEKILFDGPWMLPTHDLPFVEFPGPRVPGSTTNESVVTHARPLQKELNRTLSQIVMHKNLTLKPQLLAPQGSVTQRVTDEAGAIIEFLPVGNFAPQWREMPAIPPYVFEHINDIQGRMDRLFNLQAITRGDVPPNVEAGIAIDLLQEAAVDQIAPVIQAHEDALARAGDLMATLAQKFYTEPRMLKIIGPGGTTQVKRFLGSDLNGFSFHAEAGSGLPRTRAGRMARIEQLMTMGVLDPQSAWKYLDVADLKGVTAKFAADEEQAYREHDKITKGIPVNPIAAQQAMQAVQQGMNPQTGQPLQQQDNPAELVQDAGLNPLPFENYQVHLDTHALFMKSVEFESLPPDAQERFIDHFTQTLHTFLSLPQRPEPQAIRPTLQLKGTVDPATAAQVLQHSGVIEADPNNLAQPPLDTWVTDDLSKPQAHGSGNDPMDEMEQVQSMQHAEEQHQATMAKADASEARAQQMHDAQLKKLNKQTEQVGKKTPSKGKA